MRQLSSASDRPIVSYASVLRYTIFISQKRKKKEKERKTRPVLRWNEQVVAFSTDERKIVMSRKNERRKAIIKKEILKVEERKKIIRKKEAKDEFLCGSRYQ